MTLSELLLVMQEFGSFVVIVLLAYVVFKIGLLIEAMTERIRGIRE